MSLRKSSTEWALSHAVVGSYWIYLLLVESFSSSRLKLESSADLIFVSLGLIDVAFHFIFCG